MIRRFVALLLVVSACGGSTGASTGPTSSQATPRSEAATEASVNADVQAVVDSIVAAHGEDGGFDAIIWAFERGYSADQLFVGALDERLQADGVIISAGGGTEAPDGSPLGLIVLPSPELQSLGITVVLAVFRTASHSLVAFDAMTLQEYKEKFADAELSALMILIVGAARTGYSGQQIIELVIQGGHYDGLSLEPEVITLSDGSVQITNTTTCSYLRDLTDQIVVPAFEAPVVEDSSGCTAAIRELADKEQSERQDGVEAVVPSDEPLPWTYEGTASSHSSARLDFGVRGSIEYGSERPFTITLNQDGTVDATWHAGSVTTVAVHCETNPPTGDLSSIPVDATSLQLAGTHGDGAFSITDPSGGLDIQGTYTASQIQADWKIDISVAACGDFPDAGNLHLSGSASLVLDRVSPASR